MHATSKDKVFSIDLTPAHEYNSNFGYSVLMNKLNSWFAKEAGESAERQGGGIVSGVTCNLLLWDEANDKTILQTNELDQFRSKGSNCC